MLVLTRKEGEQIRIGDDVVVTVVRLSGDRVRIGIQAPAHTTIMRDELTTDVLKQKNRLASRKEGIAAGRINQKTVSYEMDVPVLAALF